MDDNVRAAARKIFADLGLSEEEAIELFYRRTIAAGKMPFMASAQKEQLKVKKKRMNEWFAEWDAF